MDSPLLDTPSQGRSPRILLVDDELSNLTLLQAMLRQAGYVDLVAVQDPRQVVGQYQAAPTDLVVLDLNMPVLDGFAVIEQLKGLGDPLLAPIMVLTAQRGREHVARALASGARDYLSKPFDRLELLARVRNLLDSHLAHRMVHERRAVLEEMVQQRTHEVQASRRMLLQRLGRAAEFRDEETGNHILRMSHTAALLARSAGWTPEAADMLLDAAPMHDVGKIGIPDKILLKPGRLDPDEMRIMQSHTVIGARILEGGHSPLLEMAASVALTHHEKWNGSGYPQGLRGDAIPEAGRLCAVADVFDALLARRPYKLPWSLERALEYLRAEAGTHFEPRLVALFEANLDAILAIRARFPDAEHAGQPASARPVPGG